MELRFDTISKEYRIMLLNSLKHDISLGMDVYGNIQRMDNLLGAMEGRMKAKETDLKHVEEQLKTAEEAKRPFPQEEELKKKQERLDKLNIELNLDKPENAVVYGENGEMERDGLKEKALER